MIRVLAVTKERKWLRNCPLEQLHDPSVLWYWVDFDQPTEEEAQRLSDFFQFHPLAVEDCLHNLQRPKLDYYDGYTFFVMHAVNQRTLEAEEVDMFIGKNYVVTFHSAPSEEISVIWKRVEGNDAAAKRGPFYIAYEVMDKLVDYYFPCLYNIEDRLDDIENGTRSTRVALDRLFQCRSDLLKLRRSIFPMRDLLYRILNSDSIQLNAEQRRYFTDIYDHLLRLSEKIESNREMSSDMRDNYLSVNSNRMNTVMVTLTVITTIFMPLSFIAGIYGMNFEYMPELTWKYGYFMVLGVMVVTGFSMFLWFRRKGWFHRD